MRRLSKLAFAAALLTFVSAAGAEGIQVYVGKWKLNVAKSKTESWSPRSQTRVYEDWGDGLLHARFEGVDTQGKPSLNEYVARIDGRAYPYVVRGATAAYTISIKRVDARTFTFQGLADGKMSWSGTHAVAADGKSFTITYRTNADGERSNAVLVYDKQ
jgi:hypothetical protein